MACATRFPKVRYHSEHCNERTWMCYHQVPPLARVVAHVGDAGQAKPHLEHNPFSLLRACHATPIRKLNDPERNHQGLDNQLITRAGDVGGHMGPVVRRERLGGLLRYYYREAA